MNDASVDASYSWLAEPFGNYSYSSENLAQTEDSTKANPIIIGGIPVDIDVAKTPDFGQWEYVTPSVTLRSTGALKNRTTGLYQNTLTITNTSAQTLSGSLVLALQSLTAGVTVQGATVTIGGTSMSLTFVNVGGTVFVTVPKRVLAGLASGLALQVALAYSDPANAVIAYTFGLFSVPGA